MYRAISVGAQTKIFPPLTPATLSDATLLSGLGVIEGLKGISTPKPTKQLAPLVFFPSANILNNFSKWVKGAG